ncbi:MULTISPECIES: sugar ABC transporter ATP-binding protein [Nocardioides]|uniref:Sugar ABC transporter ATP-binding protein n=1 Tax=Nocardioides vastitatis TaxID=2568655 RepID=A0ABW0ZQ21_9ACTN|nr:sugar ABC transporter ATP-binding protein [Nocardioides sp.]
MRTSEDMDEVDTGQHQLSGDLPVLSLGNVSKTFAGTQALESVDLDIRAGEVHALVGQNGSGKSTLIKLLAGYHQPDPGSVARYNGEEFHLGQRDTSGFSHIRFVHQDLGLVLEMSATENLALSAGFITGTSGRVHWKEQEERTKASLARLGVDLDIRKPLGAATPVERTIVAIAAALTGWESGRGLLVLDEPTAVLPHTEVDRLLEIVRGIQRLGASVLYVSHRLDEIFKIADRVTVLRDGRVVTTKETVGLNTQSLAELMVGERVDAAFRLARSPVDAEASVLAVRDLAGGTLRRLTASVAPGEILGIAGFTGSGSEVVPYLLAGARPATSGQVKLADGKWHPASRLRRSGFPLVPADRQREAAVADFTVAENLTLRVMESFSRGGALSAKREADVVREWIKKLQIKVANSEDSIMSLSGGNQQKVIMGRCLAADPSVLVLAEPTAGVDVGTRQAIYELIGGLADRGLAVVVTSTDTTDLIALCSRVIVLSRGEQCSELVGDAIDEHSLLAAMEAGTP